MNEKKLTGNIARERIRMMETPRLRAAEVLDLAKQKSAAEEHKCAAIDAGVPVADLPA